MSKTIEELALAWEEKYKYGSIEKRKERKY